MPELAPNDRLHPDGGDDSWFEAFWFAFYVPERKLTVYVYPWFRAGLGVCGGGVIAWDDRGHEPWTIVHHDYAVAKRFAGEASMIDGMTIRTPQGVTIACHEPGQSYTVSYEHPALALEFRFDALGPANVTQAATAETDIFKGHIDQPGRYTGWVRIGDETLPIDCHCVRDRSWGPRRDDATDLHIGYYHATASADDAFLLVTHAGGSADEFALLSGYLIRDGVHAPLASGQARITRDGERCPATCRLEAIDALGRALQAEGRSLTRLSFQPQPGMFNWSTMAEWRFGDVTAFGELQDTWHPDRYRRFARAQDARA